MAIALLTVSCATDEINAPRGPDKHSIGPGFAVADGARGGNPHFFFLPPMVASPRFTGTTDGTKLPVVTVCPLDRTTLRCGAVIARFETVPSGLPIEQIRYDPQSESYLVIWDTRRCLGVPCSLDPARNYRLNVSVAGTMLGSADLDVVGRVRELLQVNYQENVGVVQGLPLPISFRIEEGAVVVAAPSTVAQTLSVPAAVAGKTVELTLQPNTVLNASPASSVGLTVTPRPAPINTGAVAGTAYEFGPTGTTFSEPVTVTVPYDPARLNGVPPDKLRLYQVRPDGRLEATIGSTVNVTGQTVSGRTDHFSTYVVAGQIAALDIVQFSITVHVGKTSELDVTVDQPGRVITWQSLNPEFATVDDFGVVSGVAPGGAVVYAVADGQLDTTMVSVVAAP